MNLSAIRNFTPIQKSVTPVNRQLSAVVNQMNQRAKMKQLNFDTVEFDLQRKNLKQLTEVTKGEEAVTKIDHTNSPQVGVHTEAEWAEEFLEHTRNGMNSLKHGLEYEKERLTDAVSKMEALTRLANGDFSNEEDFAVAMSARGQVGNPAWESQIKERASELLTQCKTFITRDFSKVVDNFTGLYSKFARVVYPKKSVEMADQAAEGLTMTPTAEGLGLTDLSDDPKEIMAALNGATERLQEMSMALEKRFEEATGKKMAVDDTPYGSSRWENRINTENMLVVNFDVSQASFTGESFTIDPEIMQKLKEAFQ